MFHCPAVRTATVRPETCFYETMAEAVLGCRLDVNQTPKRMLANLDPTAEVFNNLYRSI
jgi:hypothetical protein